ncbi:ATP-binding protein [Pseudomonas sp. MWU16-30317]|uniref:two-component system sensor histidine kinase NtrB n=1 Tax=Pseudomonas sp. MWU16-30317 TaxID=2878095 RepID=UPI001CF9B9EE|nr:ATP-binding protein [Pseudomonas sp. MWU16-30317]
MPLRPHCLIPEGPWSQRYSQDLIENLPVGVYVCNSDAVLVAYNRKASEIWGQTPTCGDPEIKFCGAHKLYTPDGVFLPHDETPMVKVLATGEPILNIDVIVERRDGSRVNVIANITPLFDFRGNQIGFTNCVQDVTFQKQQEIERLNLVRGQFHSQKMLAIGQLTMGFAHDFNNVLTTVIASLGLVERNLDRQNIVVAAKYAKDALRGAKNASTVVSRLMRFSRCHELKSELADINALIVSLVEMSACSLGSSVKVSMQLAEGLAPAYLDPNQFENALLNILINARDALRGSGEILIVTDSVIPDKYVCENSSGLSFGVPCARIQISDNGIGMSPDLIPKIFEPFFTTKADGKGTGLGLSMVYGYVIQTGGWITVISQQGAGTCFSIYIPFCGSCPSKR